MTTRTRTSLAPLLAITLLASIFALAACGSDGGSKDADEPSNNETPSNNDGSNTNNANNDEIPCDVLLEADLVPHDATDTALVFTFDYPEDWTVHTALEDETFLMISMGRSLRRTSTLNGVEFVFIQHHEDAEPNLEDWAGAPGYTEVDQITFDGQPVTIMGKLTNPGQLSYVMFLPVTKADQSQGYVLVTTQISLTEDRCLEERMDVFKDVVPTFRPNAGTTLVLE